MISLHSKYCKDFLPKAKFHGTEITKFHTIPENDNSHKFLQKCEFCYQKNCVRKERTLYLNDKFPHEKLNIPGLRLTNSPFVSIHVNDKK